MNEQERELDLLVAELEQENRLLRARNERLEREALAAPVQEPVTKLFGSLPVYDTPPAQPAPVREDWGPGPHEYHSLPSQPAPILSAGPITPEMANWSETDKAELVAAIEKHAAQPAPVQEPDYKQLYEQVCEQYDVLAKELEATNRQVEILSDALAESRREIASIKQAITDSENQPSQFGTVTMAHMQREVAAEREACAKACDEVDKESQSQWPKRLATMIRARGRA